MYSGAYASCIIAYIKQALKACSTNFHTIYLKTFKPFCIGFIYPEHRLAQPKNALKAYFLITGVLKMKKYIISSNHDSWENISSTPEFDIIVQILQ